MHITYYMSLDISYYTYLFFWQDDDANKQFLDDINKGRVPAEFAGEHDIIT